MNRTIKKVAVLGSGVMGSRIACHFANIGVPVLLLDTERFGDNVGWRIAFLIGPVLAIVPFDTEDEAVALANDTEYGLNASVWGGDLKRAESVARRIESGNVNINDILATAFASKGTPSGGVKQSGVGARHGDQGLTKYTDVQNLAVLKKQVMGAKPGQDYDKYVKGMLSGLKMMRKTRIR